MGSLHYLWALRTKLRQNKKQEFAQKILSDVLLAFAFLAVNNLDV